MQKEIWKEVKGYESLYEVSNLGRVKSFKKAKPAILNPTCDGHGYKGVKLFKDGKGKTNPIHKLVAMAFLNHKPCGYKLVIDHIDNNKINNNVSNLQIITPRENVSKDKKGFSSIYVGVTWDKSRCKWLSSIVIKGKKKNLGRFKCELSAGLAYKKALKELSTIK